MRTTNYVCLLVACIATTSTVEAIAVNQLEQIPSDLAQADVAAGLFNHWWGKGKKPNCLHNIKLMKLEALALFDGISDVQVQKYTDKDE